MPRLKDYYCNKCGKRTEDVFYRNAKDVLKEIKCSHCGGKAKLEFGMPMMAIDTWSPMGGHANDAQRDRDHFEKKTIKDGKYVSNQTAYKVDRMKADIPMNISEV